MAEHQSWKKMGVKVGSKSTFLALWASEPCECSFWYFLHRYAVNQNKNKYVPGIFFFVCTTFKSFLSAVFFYWSWIGVHYSQTFVGEIPLTMKTAKPDTSYKGGCKGHSGVCFYLISFAGCFKYPAGCFFCLPRYFKHPAGCLFWQLNVFFRKKSIKKYFKNISKDSVVSNRDFGIYRIWVEMYFLCNISDRVSDRPRTMMPDWLTLSGEFLSTYDQFD